MVLTAVVGGILSTSSGCQLALVPCKTESASYVLVEHEAASLVSTTAAPEVSEAGIYAQILPSVKTIGLQFPDHNCKTESAAQATGQSRSADAIMGTQCGVWLAELERALTDQRYKVISWSAIRQEQDTKRVSTYEAARNLGADVVFVVNSMETSDIKRNSAAGRRTAYFRSDSMGVKGNKLALEQSEREPLKRFVSRSSGRGALDGIVGWAGTLDVTAVRASTGESIWFFRHSISKPRATQSGMRFLFRKPAAAAAYTPVRPGGLPEQVQVEDRSSEDIERVSLVGGPADAFKAEKHDLARSVARECVHRFNKAR